MKANYTEFVISAAVVGGVALNIVASFLLLFVAFVVLGALGIDAFSSGSFTNEFLVKVVFASYAGIMMPLFKTLRKYNRSHARMKNTRYEAVAFFAVPLLFFFLDTLDPVSFLGMCSTLTALGLYEYMAIRYKGFGMYRV